MEDRNKTVDELHEMAMGKSKEELMAIIVELLRNKPIETNTTDTSELKKQTRERLRELFFQYGFCDKDNVLGVCTQSYLEMSEDMINKIHRLYEPHLQQRVATTKPSVEKLITDSQQSKSSEKTEREEQTNG